MIEREVKIGTKHGEMLSFVACPDEGRHPPVILYMDAPGYREELKNMARRFAANGYFCVLPDMYYRLGRVHFDVRRRDERMSTVIRAARLTVSNEMVVDDTGGILAYIDAQPQAKPGPVGIAGHCMSGSYVMAVAARYPSRIAAAAAYYGVQIVTEEKDSPHLIADRIKAEVYLSFGEIDELVPEHVIPTLKEIFAKHRIVGDVEQPAGTRHGYLFPERGVYHPVAAEAAWAKTLALFERRLR